MTVRGSGVITGVDLGVTIPADGLVDAEGTVQHSRAVPTDRLVVSGRQTQESRALAHGDKVHLRPSFQIQPLEFKPKIITRYGEQGPHVAYVLWMKAEKKWLTAKRMYGNFRPRYEAGRCGNTSQTEKGECNACISRGTTG